jgi:hypothetical protein
MMMSDELHTKRVKAVAAALVEGMIVSGEIPLTEEAIRAAMPQAVADARQVVNAAEEYLCG